MFEWANPCIQFQQRKHCAYPWKYIRKSFPNHLNKIFSSQCFFFLFDLYFTMYLVMLRTYSSNTVQILMVIVNFLNFSIFHTVYVCQNMVLFFFFRKSVPYPDPLVFGPSGSGPFLPSTTNKLRKTFISTVSWLLYDLLS